MGVESGVGLYAPCPDWTSDNRQPSVFACSTVHRVGSEIQIGLSTELATVGQNSSITRINQKLQAFDVWSAVSIDKRQELLMGLSREVWKTVPLSIE